MNESFITDAVQLDSIHTNLSNSTTTLISHHEVYVNTITNIHDIDSLIHFYQLMFGENIFVLFTTIMLGLYVGCMLIQNNSKK